MSHIDMRSSLWDVVEQASVLEKYQVAFVACGRPQFDRGADPYQSADGLIKIRNALIHYRPEWDHDLDVHKTIEKRLTGRFPLNRLIGPEQLWFPHRCLGAGCAAWGVERAVRFMEEFCRRLGIPDRAE